MTPLANNSHYDAQVAWESLQCVASLGSLEVINDSNGSIGARLPVPVTNVDHSGTVRACILADASRES